MFLRNIIFKEHTPDLDFWKIPSKHKFPVHTPRFFFENLSKHKFPSIAITCVNNLDKEYRSCSPPKKNK